MRQNRQLDFLKFRKLFPVFSFESFSVEIFQTTIVFKFNFNISDTYFFKPELIYHVPPRYQNQIDGRNGEWDLLAFNLGLAELVSYWKITCSPQVVIKAGFLTDENIQWWKNLYYNGLGEFFYLNNITCSIADFLDISSTCTALKPISAFSNFSQRVLVPVGGGKDSVVTLELLKRAGLDAIPFIVNPRGASAQCALRAGFNEEDVFNVSRKLDPLMLKLNNEGYLNGHTPFSALLAFATLPAAAITGARHIALSNEASANESTVPGSNVNHQYSKTIDFENDFRHYVKTNFVTDFNYFSFLRPLNELQIASRFSGFPDHHEVFRSCNVGSKSDSWCGKCPKCLFTAVMLAPFLGVNRVHQLVGHPLLDDISLMPLLYELTGKAPTKPFECVGTVSEVLAAVQYIATKGEKADLVNAFLADFQIEQGPDEFNRLLAEVNSNHNLPAVFENLLQ